MTEHKSPKDRALAMRTAVTEFQDAIRAEGLNPPDYISPGKYHRFLEAAKLRGNKAPRQAPGMREKRSTLTAKSVTRVPHPLLVKQRSYLTGNRTNNPNSDLFKCSGCAPFGTRLNSLPSEVRPKEACDITGLSRSTMYSRMKAGSFPPSIPIGCRLVGFSSFAIDEWVHAVSQGNPYVTSDANFGIACEMSEMKA